jgi:hypothetical protein
MTHLVFSEKSIAYAGQQHHGDKHRDEESGGHGEGDDGGMSEVIRLVW